jgi:hypothetical protein
LKTDKERVDVGSRQHIAAKMQKRESEFLSSQRKSKGAAFVVVAEQERSKRRKRGTVNYHPGRPIK